MEGVVKKILWAAHHGSVAHGTLLEGGPGTQSALFLIPKGVGAHTTFCVWVLKSYRYF